MNRPGDGDRRVRRGGGHSCFRTGQVAASAIVKRLHPMMEVITHSVLCGEPYGS